MLSHPVDQTQMRRNLRSSSRTIPSNSNKTLFLARKGPEAEEETLFALWYHVTTNLTNEEIAECMNCTFPKAGISPGGIEEFLHDLKDEYDNIRKNPIRFKIPPKPMTMGWYPCDHGKICNGSLDQGINVTRKRNTRPVDSDLLEMATKIWPLSPADLVNCPRDHSSKAQWWKSHFVPATIASGMNSRLTRHLLLFSLSVMKSFSVCLMYFKLLDFHFEPLAEMLRALIS